MMSRFSSNKTIFELENKPGITYIGEMVDGSELYRGFETNLILSGAEEIYITGKNVSDIKRAKSGLQKLLNLKLKEIKKECSLFFPYDRQRYQAIGGDL